MLNMNRLWQVSQVVEQYIFATVFFHDVFLKYQVLVAQEHLFIVVFRFDFQAKLFWKHIVVIPVFVSVSFNMRNLVTIHFRLLKGSKIVLV